MMQRNMVKNDDNDNDSHRERLICEFIAQHGFADARRIVIAGDASFRRYERLQRRSGGGNGNGSNGGNGNSVILMDAPPPQEDVLPFIHVGEFLREHGFSAPKILAQDRKNGLLLLEDLGDDLFSRVLEKNPQSEEEIYIAATRTLLSLHHITPPPDLPIYDESLLLDEVRLFSDWYLPLIPVKKDVPSLREDFCHLWHELLQQLPEFPPVVVLRDFHADNLLWLPQRNGVARVGLLDFQDAVIGSPVYDIISFIEDARRDVTTETTEAVVDFYLTESGLDKNDFAVAAAILAAQRNSKIIGIFTRLALRDGKCQYLRLIPHVWQLLERDLEHPALITVRKWLNDNVPCELHSEIPQPQL